MRVRVSDCFSEIFTAASSWYRRSLERLRYIREKPVADPPGEQCSAAVRSLRSGWPLRQGQFDSNNGRTIGHRRYCTIAPISALPLPARPLFPCSTGKTSNFHSSLLPIDIFFFYVNVAVRTVQVRSRATSVWRDYWSCRRDRCERGCYEEWFFFMGRVGSTRFFVLLRTRNVWLTETVILRCYILNRMESIISSAILISRRSGAIGSCPAVYRLIFRDYRLWSC